MSEKLTRIALSSLPMGEGYLDWGEQSAEHMIALIRHRAAHFRKVADAIDAAADDDFKIDIVRGNCVQHHVRNIQPGRSA